MLRLDVSYSIENIKYNNAPPAHHKVLATTETQQLYIAASAFSFSYLYCWLLLLILLFGFSYCLCVYAIADTHTHKHTYNHIHRAANSNMKTETTESIYSNIATTCTLNILRFSSVLFIHSLAPHGAISGLAFVYSGFFLCFYKNM